MKTARVQRYAKDCLASGPKTLIEIKDYIKKRDRWGTTSQSLTVTLLRHKAFEIIPHSSQISKWRLKE